MLWILAGTYHSGKNEFRNLLIKEYGLKVIRKHLYKEKNGKCQDPDDSEVFTYTEDYPKRDICDRYRRDPYLIPVYTEDEDEVQRFIYEISNVQRDRNDRNDFIYDVVVDESEGNRKIYAISKQEIMSAIEDTKNHYLLVCSDPRTIAAIKRICRTQGGVKAILMFGLHLSDDENNDAGRVNASARAQEKIGEFLDGSNYGFIDHVICNSKHYVSDIEFQEDFIKQWEKIIEDIKNPPFRVCQANPIFFVKPFGEGRHAQIYESINNKVKKIRQEVVCSMRGEDGKEISKRMAPSETEPVSVVQYSRVDEMRRQMYEGIANAGLIISDLANVEKRDDNVQNPNCYFETGYAYGLKKEIIYMIDKNVKIPHDISDSVVLKYTLEDGEVKFEDEKTFNKRISIFYEKLKFATQNIYYHEKMIREKSKR